MVRLDHSQWVQSVDPNLQNEVYRVVVTPLQEQDAATLVKSCADEYPNADDIVNALGSLRNRNKQSWNNSETIGVLFDPRGGAKDGGYVGDIIEATRVLHILGEHSQGKTIRAIVPQTLNIFEGQMELPPGIEIFMVDLPKGPRTGKKPFHENEYRDRIVNAANNGIIYIPTVSRFPNWFNSPTVNAFFHSQDWNLPTSGPPERNGRHLMFDQEFWTKRDLNQVACSPKVDPYVMRVYWPMPGKEILDEREEAYPGADH